MHLSYGGKHLDDIIFETTISVVCVFEEIGSEIHPRVCVYLAWCTLPIFVVCVFEEIGLEIHPRACVYLAWCILPIFVVCVFEEIGSEIHSMVCVYLAWYTVPVAFLPAGERLINEGGWGWRSGRRTIFFFLLA